MRKKDTEKDLLMYSSSVIVPLALATVGTTVLLFGSLPLSSAIVVGGLVGITGFQAVVASINFCKEIKIKVNELTEINKKSEKELMKNIKDNTKTKVETNTLNKDYSSIINYPKRNEKSKVLVKKKY